ncbi:predicted protein [Aspergillus terreus NIH2624]|uniref:FAD-binding domain-containing protein n=1 Tax=Aspergillus terreus (strain NIH 2624 / FGSC A1156) TaxID=341663 RepID=Q0CZL0_ASPTN|nr:uncharacterized protein ATEG_00874 [Aspergillus terreus NIH2624]EAU39520.1 predicted protein [Aspergillus terreus NIH2624]
MTPHILIIGGGISGLASAIALVQQFASHTNPPQITVYELRDVPSTLGGPVNLTPKALRCLDMLGVLAELTQMHAGCEVDAIQIFSLRTGQELATIDYTGREGTGFGGYKGRRVKRYDLLRALLRVVERLESVTVQYGKKVTRVEEDIQGKKVRVRFEDGTSATGDIVLGCDGIHSAVRSEFVEPERVPSYSGIVSAYGFVEAKTVLGAQGTPFFKDTALAMSRYGSTLATFCDYDRELIYVVLLMPAEAQLSREGWKSMGHDQEMVRTEGLRRTQEAAIPDLVEMIEGVQDWTLYPVYILPPNGRWFTDRVMLLGDAAHAMPPKGESIGHALEDAVKFARVLGHYGIEDPIRSFRAYESAQRKKIEDAYKVSSNGWMSNHDLGAIRARLFEWFTPVFLWWTRGQQEEDFLADPGDISFSESDDEVENTARNP